VAWASAGLGLNVSTKSEAAKKLKRITLKILWPRVLPCCAQALAVYAFSPTPSERHQSIICIREGTTTLAISDVADNNFATVRTFACGSRAAPHSHPATRRGVLTSMRSCGSGFDGVPEDDGIA
jgi:hypothetical protein